MCVIGVDVGAATTKAVVINSNQKIIGLNITKSGADLKKSSQAVYESAVKSAGVKKTDVNLITATGFGRNNVTGANQAITEITAHAQGAYQCFSRKITVIDIGGQDNKIIKIDQSGKVINFKMNRKCAAGTGAFIEEISYKMDIPISRLNQIAKKSKKDLQLGSFCTVFTATEILTKIREGEPKENIIRGVFYSVAKRITEMDTLEGEVVITGGVIAHNDIMIDILKSITGKLVLVPPEPQLTGAYGAALLGLKSLGDK